MGLAGPLAAGSVSLLDEPIIVPVCPQGMHPGLEAEWDEYWCSDVARAASGVDVPVVRRLFEYRSDLHKSQDVWASMAENERWVEPTRNRNTVTAHPMIRRMEKLEEMIIRLENVLGLNPIARARLGIELGNAQLTWAQVEEKTRGGTAFVGAGARVIA